MTYSPGAKAGGNRLSQRVIGDIHHSHRGAHVDGHITGNRGCLEPCKAPSPAPLCKVKRTGLTQNLQVDPAV